MPVQYAPLIMAGAGLAGQYFGGQARTEAAMDQARAQQEALQNAMREGKEGYSDISQMYSPFQQAGLEDLQKFRQMDFSQDPGSFQYGANVEQFLDPSMQYQQEQAMNQIQGSAAAQGALGSGATLKAMQDRGQQIAQQGYGDAFNRMMQDKSFAYGQYRDRANQTRQRLMDRANQLQGVSNMGFQATGQQAQARGQQAQMASGLAQQQGNIMTPGYAQGMQRAGFIDALSDPQFLATLTTSLGGMFGGGDAS